MPNLRIQVSGSAQLLNQPAPRTSVQDADILALRGGGYVETWSEYESLSGSTVQRARIVDASGAAHSAQTISSSSGSPPNGITIKGVVTETQDGGLIFEYAQATNGFYTRDVYELSYHRDGTTQRTTIVNAFGVDETSPFATSLTNGGHVAGWQANGAITFRVYDQASQQTGSNLSIAGASLAVTAGLNNGSFVVAWQTDDPGSSASNDFMIRAGLFDSTTQQIGSTFSVGNSADGRQEHLSVAQLSSGGFVVTWVNYNTSGSSVRAQIFDASGNAMGSEILADRGGNNATNAEVTELPQGGFAVVWQDETRGTSDIHAQIFADDGSKLGDELTVNSPSTLGTRLPEVVGLADGSIIFTWVEDPSSLQSGVRLLAQKYTWITDYAGTAGLDNLGGSLSNDIFHPGAGVDFIHGYAGLDTVDYHGLASGISIDLTAQNSWDGTSMDFLYDIENAIGTAGNDVIIGSAGNNVLDGGQGGVDVINGMGGNDTVSYANALHGVNASLAAQNSWDGTSMNFLSSMENATGSAFDDILSGDGGDNVLDGGSGGTDILNGGGGNDTASYVHANGALQIYLDSQVSWDGTSMDFFSSIENAVGSRNSDVIVAAASGSMMNGWLGDDLLVGGNGADTFQFNGLDGSLNVGNDQVSGFEIGKDVIEISTQLGWVRSFADIASFAEQLGSDTVIHLNDSSSIVLVGIQLANLTSGDFHFV